MGAWAFTFFVYRISSLSALVSAVLTTIVAYMIGFQDIAAVMVIMAVLLVWKHQDNIRRLIDGTEPMSGRSGK